MRPDQLGCDSCEVLWAAKGGAPCWFCGGQGRSVMGSGDLVPLSSRMIDDAQETWRVWALGFATMRVRTQQSRPVASP